MADNISLKPLRKLAWSMLGLSFISCFARNDIDIITGLICVIMLNRFYDKGNAFKKTMSVVLIGTLCVNVVTFIMYTNYAMGEGSSYWNDEMVRVVGMVVSACVVVIKGVMLFMLYKKS